MWGYGTWMGPIMSGLLGLLVVILVLTLVIALLRWAAPVERPGRPGVTDARDLLDARFARGEIDADEYANRCRILETH